MKPSEYLEEVSQELVKNGWTQKMMYSGEGSCLYGAMVNVTTRRLIEAFTTREDIRSVWMEAKDHVERRVQDRGYASIPHFNDSVDMTLPQVLDLLHDCQIELKELGE